MISLHASLSREHSIKRCCVQIPLSILLVCEFITLLQRLPVDLYKRLNSYESVCNVVGVKLGFSF